MNSTSSLISKAVATRNIIRADTMEKAAPPAPTHVTRATPEPLKAPLAKPAAAPPVNTPLPMPVRQSVYTELMKKHDKINPRYK